MLAEGVGPSCQNWRRKGEKKRGHNEYILLHVGLLVDRAGLLPISWSSDNGNYLFVDSVDEGSGRSSSIGTYLTQVAANSAGV